MSTNHPRPFSWHTEGSTYLPTLIYGRSTSTLDFRRDIEAQPSPSPRLQRRSASSTDVADDLNARDPIKLHPVVQTSSQSTSAKTIGTTASNRDSSVEHMQETPDFTMSFGTRSCSYVNHDQRHSNPVVTTFTCGICLVDKELDTASTLHPCSHPYCVPCLAGYLIREIAYGRAELRCPFVSNSSHRCETTLGEDLVCSIVTDADVIAKLRRLLAMRDNPNLRPCPTCDVLQEGEALHPAMVCGACDTAFCFSHADAHPSSESCDAFQVRTQRRDFIASETTVAKVSKSCPSCRVPTQKTEGCHHMTCTQCKTSWCWQCGKSGVEGGHYALCMEPQPDVEEGASFRCGRRCGRSRKCFSNTCQWLCFILLMANIAFPIFGLPIMAATSKNNNSTRTDGPGE